MVRYLTAAVLGCLYVAGSIFIVRNAGEAHRDRLNKAKRLPTELAKAPLAPKEEKDARNPPIASRDSTSARPEPMKAGAPPTPLADAPAKPAAAHPSLGPVTTELAKAPATSPSGKNAAAPPAANPNGPNPLIRNEFWSQSKLTHEWNVAHMSLKEERDLGADLHELIVRFNPLVKDPGDLLSRVEDAADPFLKTLRRKEIHYQFFILNSDVVNAFSTPGGYVYVSRGLFELIGEDEDYALQFAVAHEIAHVDLEHAIKCLRDVDVLKIREGTLQKLFILILPFGYKQSDPIDQEFEADEWVSNRMQQLQRTRREILVFLQKLEGYSKNHGFYEGRVPPQPGHDLSPLENHYRAQTAARKRLKHLKEFIASPLERSK
jgi:hypothetical protein